MRAFFVSDRNTNNDLIVGDLVTHILYGKRWIGIITGFRVNEEDSSKRNTKALVQIQPGTEFEGFFKRTPVKDRMNENLGYVSIHWLFKIEVKDGNTGPSRNEVPSS